MKPALAILMFLGQICFSQFIPHKATPTPSKQEILSTETFTVTYELSEVEGYVYVGLMDDYLEVIGPARWEGQVELPEVKTLTFTLKLKPERILGCGEIVPIRVAFSYKPFGEIVAGVGISTNIKIKDFETIKDSLQRSMRGGSPEGTVVLSPKIRVWGP